MIHFLCLGALVFVSRSFAFVRSNAASLKASTVLQMAENQNEGSNNPFSGFSSILKETLGVEQPAAELPSPKRTVPLSGLETRNMRQKNENGDEISIKQKEPKKIVATSRLTILQKSIQEKLGVAPENQPLRTMPIPKLDELKQAVTRIDGDNKFGMAQRIESVKCGVLGALCGSIAVAPVAYYHYSFLQDTMAQFEFTTDMAALQGALFAIVYRYAIRNDSNPMLNQGVIGAFVVVRTLSNIRVSDTCSAIPLQCGEPLGYLNYDMLAQAAIQGAESAVLFGAVALAMDFAFELGWITKFE